MKTKIIIDNAILEKYRKYYFETYPKRRKFPISSPIPPSLNRWMVMKRFEMNHQKQVWKDFGCWMVKHYNLSDMKISRCDIEIEYFFPDTRRRDADNYTPKNLFDSFTASGLLVDDDFNHVESLTIRGNYSKGEAKTVITIRH